MYSCFVHGQLQEAELENVILKNSCLNRLRRLGITSRTKGTSGHFVQQGTPASLLACIVTKTSHLAYRIWNMVLRTLSLSSVCEYM